MKSSSVYLSGTEPQKVISIEMRRLQSIWHLTSPSSTITKYIFVTDPQGGAGQLDWENCADDLFVMVISGAFTPL